MAPKRKPTGSTNSGPATRVARSSARLANATAAPPAAEPASPKKKKVKTKAPATVEEETVTESPPSLAEGKPTPEPDTKDSRKTIIIEHCKQCSSFKTRAIQVKTGVEKSVNVLVNPEKPRRGCFEIREKSGDIFVSLLDMKRPFRPMKDLDMENLISSIVEKFRG